MNNKMNKQDDSDEDYPPHQGQRQCRGTKGGVGGGFIGPYQGAKTIQGGRTIREAPFDDLKKVKGLCAPSSSSLLQERNTTHGEFKDNAVTTSDLRFSMRNKGVNWDKLSDTQVLALDMIQHKISRILSGDPNFKDHWDDIAGYAKLISEELKGK